jgi:DNA-binding NtrC family response regulator
VADRILVADDEDGIRETLGFYLRGAGFEVITVASGEEAVRRLRSDAVSLVIADIVMPGLDGLEVLARTRELDPPPPVILMTAYATVEMAIEALLQGAEDFLVKPFQLHDVGARVRRLLAARMPAESPAVVTARCEGHVGRLVGQSEAIEAVRRRMARVAGTSAHVLVTGETGTGKELVARGIHAASPRALQPFVALNCGAIPDGLFESMLFGHARGAFTTALHANVGLMTAADRGTLFLDEIGETPIHLQVKLLRALEEKQVLPVGRTTPVRVDCRIIASTNRDLKEEIAAGRFRDDLFYRLKVVKIDLPPLRSRREDVGLLVVHFMQELNTTLGTAFKRLEPAALDALLAHDWPGNVRELLHVVEAAMIAGSGDTIAPEDLPVELQAPPDDASLRDATRAFERQHIRDMLARTEFDKREAARRLGVSLASLYRKLDGKPG